MKPNSKTLYLVRHAKAVKPGSGVADFDRGLHEQGIAEAYAMSEILYNKQEKPQMILSSPAARAIHTAIIFQRALRVPDASLHVGERLYEIAINELYELVTGLDDRYHSVMLVGHNPSFTQFAAKMDSALVHMPTGSVVRFDFNVEKWRHCSYINADLKLFLYP